MPTTRVLATALPRSLAPQGPHLTAFVTLKLDPGAADGRLSDFPAAAAWVDTLTAGSWELVTDAVAAPLPVHPPCAFRECRQVRPGSGHPRTGVEDKQPEAGRPRTETRLLGAAQRVSGGPPLKNSVRVIDGGPVQP